MSFEERILKVLISPHVSEKASSVMEKHDVVVFNVVKKSTKVDVKLAVERLFETSVYGVRTLNVKKKMKKGSKGISRRKMWKRLMLP